MRSSYRFVIILGPLTNVPKIESRFTERINNIIAIARNALSYRIADRAEYFYKSFDSAVRIFIIYTLSCG